MNFTGVMKRGVFFPAVLCVAACSATVQQTNTSGYSKTVQGNSVARVVGNSMEPTLPAGSLVSIQPIGYADLRDSMIVEWSPDGGAHNVKRVKLDHGVFLRADNPTLHVKYKLSPDQLEGLVVSYVTPDGRIWTWSDGSGYGSVE